MKRPLSRTQSIFISLLWLALVYVMLVTAARIDGPVILTILMSAAFVFIPVYRSWKQRKGR
ncbi:MAG: hypothetical protein LBM61_00725 [Prevotellaceae bacterium]|nr:hypothetical protein [Prevotellaceae bacterium]